MSSPQQLDIPPTIDVPDFGPAVATMAGEDGDVGEDYNHSVVERLKLLLCSSDESASAAAALTDEATSEIRRLLVRRLPESACGEEDRIAPIRANLWSVLLLGLRPEDLNSQHNLVSSSLHGRTSEADHAQGLMHFPKEDQRVLAADIKRTRQAYAMFKREEVMQIVSRVLERYCVGHGIRYKQGQNELIAPFIVLQDPPLPLPVLGLLFESFMSRFVSRWFVDDEIEALLVSYRVFRVLLFYVDPGLAFKLDEADFVPELYATAWLITLFSRNLSLELVMRLWDVYLAVNDPALVFFLLAALLVRNRETIVSVQQAHMMPETIQGLTIDDKQDLEELIIQAREMLRKIPASFLRTVRSCCSDHGNTPLDTSRSLFCESVRCASIGAEELLERMAGRSAHSADATQEENEEEGRNRSPCPMRPGPLDTVALDIRPADEYESSGVGHLGKSVRLDPRLLDMEDVLEKWMQHFDGTRGTHVCLVDSLEPSPVAGSVKNTSHQTPYHSNNKDRKKKGGGGGQTQGNHSSSSSSKSNSINSIVEDPLWRRLLFGEGEAASAEDDWANASAHRDHNNKNSANGMGGAGSAAIAGRGGGADRGTTPGGVLDDAAGEEGFGAAKAFAEKLHARGFPYVSILEGGMESVVEHLKDKGSPLEPTVINHDRRAYQSWRDAQARRNRGPRAVASRAGEAFSWRGKAHDGSSAALYEEGIRQGERTAEAGEGVGDHRVGVMDRLGLARMRDGVSQGVGTMARTAGMIAGSASDVSVNGHILEKEEGERDDDGSNIWEEEALTDEDGRDLTAIFGAIKNAQAGLRDGVARGATSVRRSGARAVKAGAGMMPKSNPFSEADFAIPEKIPSSSSSTERATMPGSAAEGSGLAAQEARAFPAEMGRHPCSNEEKDKAMLLKALETAQANGHMAAAKALRARLGFIQGQELRARAHQGRSMSAEQSTNHAVLESLADLA